MAPSEPRPERPSRRSSMPAGAEARVRTEVPDARHGQWIVVASWLCTAVFALTAVPAAVDPDRFAAAAFACALGLFFLGLGVFAWAYLTAVLRSREVEMGMGGLFLLLGSAPRRVQRHLNGSLVVQGAVALATAAARPFTPLAFGTLVPLVAMAWSGLWAARHGTFAPRRADERSRRPRGPVRQTRGHG